MNKTKTKIAFGIGIVALLAVLSVSTASANVTVYFVPQDSSVPEGEGYSAYVEVWLSTEDPDTALSGQFAIHYDPSCVNITEHPVYGEDAGWGECIMSTMSSWNANPNCHGDGYDMVMYTFIKTVPHAWCPSPQKIANFTVQCTSSEYCVSNLSVSCGRVCSLCPIQILDGSDINLYPDNTTFVDGTFECGTPAETYTISGYTDPAADTVNITNLNKSDVVKNRPADYIGPDGFYNLTLDVPGEVNVSDVLQITACEDLGDYESNCNVSDHVAVNAPGEDTNVNLTLNHYCMNYYPDYPYYIQEQDNWSGPAVMQACIAHYNESDGVPIPSQAELNETGIANNHVNHTGLLYVDPQGMEDTLNYYLHHWPDYYHNYAVFALNMNDALHRICYWQHAGPGAVPAYSDYSNWMAVRGIHTSKKPTDYYAPYDYDVYGFWVNDPNDGSGSIGENSYKTADEFTTTYYIPTIDEQVPAWNDKYMSVLEPPEHDADVRIVPARPRFAKAISPALAEKPLMVYGIEQLALEKVVKDDEMLKIVKAAIDGITEELVPYDAEFAEVFAKTVPGEPMLVTGDNGDYYIVPFNVPVEVRPPVKKVPVEIERVKVSGLKKFERVKRLDANAVIEPIPIEPIKVERTLVVVLVDADDGSFKEASWVADPVKYLPVSKSEALKLALGEVLDELHIVARKDARDLEVITQKPTIELVYRDASPYYPDWKVTVNGKVFYVGQDGTVSYDKPIPMPTLSPKPSPIQILPI